MNYEHIGILHPSSRRGSAAPAQTYYIPKDICSCKQEGAATRLDADSENSCVSSYTFSLVHSGPENLKKSSFTKNVLNNFHEN